MPGRCQTLGKPTALPAPLLLARGARPEQPQVLEEGALAPRFPGPHPLQAAADLADRSPGRPDQVEAPPTLALVGERIQQGFHAEAGLPEPLQERHLLLEARPVPLL